MKNEETAWLTAIEESEAFEHWASLCNPSVPFPLVHYTLSELRERGELSSSRLLLQARDSLSTALARFVCSVDATLAYEGIGLVWIRRGEPVGISDDSLWPKGKGPKPA